MGRRLRRDGNTKAAIRTTGERHHRFGPSLTAKRQDPCPIDNPARSEFGQQRIGKLARDTVCHRI